jgi:hypothetical protein
MFPNPAESGQPFTERTDQGREFTPVNEHDGQQGAEVDEYLEGDAFDMHIEQFLRQHQMTGTAHRQKFGESLDDPQDHCLQ